MACARTRTARHEAAGTLHVHLAQDQSMGFLKGYDGRCFCWVLNCPFGICSKFSISESGPNGQLPFLIHPSCFTLRHSGKGTSVMQIRSNRGCKTPS